jgi:hypothetical protein
MAVLVNTINELLDSVNFLTISFLRKDLITPRLEV